jgi:hypothetical protein
MAELTDLHTVKTMLASFRQHPRQKSADVNGYLAECDGVRRPRGPYLKYLILPISTLLERRMIKPGLL